MTPKKAIKLLKRYGNDQENVMELYEIIENELDDYKHNYKALKEFHDNSVAYATKIQSELNELKRDVARYFEIGIKHRKSLDELREFWALEEKLQKVGKEE